jgi:hypothetical protein
MKRKKTYKIIEKIKLKTSILAPSSTDAIDGRVHDRRHGSAGSVSAYPLLDGHNDHPGHTPILTPRMTPPDPLPGGHPGYPPGGSVLGSPDDPPNRPLPDPSRGVTFGGSGEGPKPGFGGLTSLSKAFFGPLLVDEGRPLPLFLTQKWQKVAYPTFSCFLEGFGGYPKNPPFGGGLEGYFWRSPEDLQK